jgi:hypothetical protein
LKSYWIYVTAIVLMVPKFMFAMYLLKKNKWYVCPMVIGRCELRQSAILTLKYIYIYIYYGMHQIFFLHYCTKNISSWSQITFQWHLVTYKNVIKMAAVQTSWFIFKKNSLLASVLHYALLHYKNNGNILTTPLKDKIPKKTVLNNLNL